MIEEAIKWKTMIKANYCCKANQMKKSYVNWNLDTVDDE